MVLWESKWSRACFLGSWRRHRVSQLRLLSEISQRGCVFLFSQSQLPRHRREMDLIRLFEQRQSLLPMHRSSPPLPPLSPNSHLPPDAPLNFLTSYIYSLCPSLECHLHRGGDCCLLCLLFSPLHKEERLVHNRCSPNIGRMNNVQKGLPLTTVLSREEQEKDYEDNCFCCCQKPRAGSYFLCEFFPVPRAKSQDCLLPTRLWAGEQRRVYAGDKASQEGSVS